MGRPKRRRAVLTIAICVAVVAAPLSAWQGKIHAEELAIQAQDQMAVAEIARNYPGARALESGFVNAADQDLPLKPAMTALDKQWVSLNQKCGGDFAVPDGPLSEVCGQTETLTKPAKTIVIVGDSHAEQFAGALIPVATDNNWQLVSLLLGGCDFGSGTGGNAKCRDFNKGPWTTF